MYDIFAQTLTPKQPVAPKAQPAGHMTCLNRPVRMMAVSAFDVLRGRILVEMKLPTWFGFRYRFVGTKLALACAIARHVLGYIVEFASVGGTD